MSFRGLERSAGGWDDNSSELSKERPDDSDSDDSIYLKKKKIVLKNKARAMEDVAAADPPGNVPHEMQVCIINCRAVWCN